MGSFYFGKDPMADSSKDGNKPAGTIKGWKFLDHLSDY
jgi:hypothetical protein